MFEIKEIASSRMFRGMDLGQTIVGELSINGEASTEILLPVRFPTFDKMRRGRITVTLGKIEPKYFTGLQVTCDPGVGLVYAGFIMLIIGCFVTFFMSHQRLCIEVTAEGKGSRVMISGTANKNKLGMQNKVKHIAEQLTRLSTESSE